MSIPSRMQAVQIQEQGGIDVMQVREIQVPQPKEGEILVKTEWAGVNFIDTYQRGGLYKIPMPFTLGNELGGTIAESRSENFKAGDKVVAYSLGGGYAQYAALPTRRVAKLPEGISTKSATAGLLQGLTSLTAIREAHPVKKGEYILVHAAAGGLGLLLCQMISALGAHVIAEKAQLAKENGAEHVILYKNRSMDEVVSDIVALTPNKEGVNAVIDGVGKDTFEANFKLLARKGTFVSIGNASGAAPAFAPLRLAEKNIKMIRPKLDNYVFTSEEFKTYSSELFEMMSQNKVKLALHKEEGYPLTTEGVRQAHEDISSRATTGKLLIKIQ